MCKCINYLFEFEKQNCMFHMLQSKITNIWWTWDHLNWGKKGGKKIRIEEEQPSTTIFSCVVHTAVIVLTKSVVAQFSWLVQQLTNPIESASSRS